MANRVQVELSAQVQGFVDGMNQADQAAKQYETDQRKITDSLGNFKKEFAQAKREVMNLASAYSKLDATAKASSFGKEMARQLEEAKLKAAEMVDMQGDLNTELKNLASDTRVFDTLSEGMGVFMSTTASALGVVAQFTGNEEDAKKAIVAFTTAQSALTAVTKIQNALQKQSNTMLAVAKVQTLAATAATKIKTAAEGKSVVVTKAATVAQAAFNKVAMMNPYVLLATAIIGVTAALGAFIVMSSKSRAEEAKAARQAEQTKSYYSALNNELTSSIPTYYKLQAEWRNLRTVGEKVQWIRDNQTEFNNLGVQINNVNDAENFLVKNTQKVIEAMVLRAKAAAQAALAQKRYQDELERQEKLRAVKGRKDLDPNDIADLGLDRNSKNVKYEGLGWISREYSVDVEKEIEESNKRITKQLEDDFGKVVDLQQEASKKLKNAGVEGVHKAVKATRETHKKESNKTKKELAKNSVEEAEGMLKAWQDKLNKADINDKKLVELINTNIKKWQKEVEKRKLTVGIDVKVKTNVDVLAEFEKQLNDAVKQAEADYMVAFNTGNTSKLDELLVKWKKAIRAKKEYTETKDLQDPSKQIEIKGNIKLAPALNGLNVEIEKTEKLIEDLNNQIKQTDWNSMGTTGQMVLESLKDDLDDTKEKLKELQKISFETPEHSLNNLSDSISVLESKLRSTANVDQLIKNGNDESVNKMVSKIIQMKLEANEMGKTLEEALMTPLERTQKELAETAEKVYQVGDAVAACGELFSALGELGDDTTLNIAGIVAKAVATVALSYAQALTTAKTWVEWLAFGLSGLATMTQMISSIKSATSGYAGGGVVGGSSYSGDRVLARVNSGELILNQRQQKNLFNLLDSDVMPQKGGTNVQVTGIIRGTDLILVQKNTNKVRAKSGTQIKF